MLRILLLTTSLILATGCVRNVSYNVADKELLILMHNTERINRGLQALKSDPRLDSNAQNHANWMAKRRRLVHQVLSAGQGENIAWGHTKEIQVFRAWMESPGHQENILDGGFTKIGIGESNSYWCVVLE